MHCLSPSPHRDPDAANQHALGGACALDDRVAGIGELMGIVDGSIRQVGQEVISVKAQALEGKCVGINYDGAIFATGAENVKTDRVFKYNATQDEWIQLGQTLPYLCYEIELSDNGKRLIVGAKNKTPNDPGQTLIFDYDETSGFSPPK